MDPVDRIALSSLLKTKIEILFAYLFGSHVSGKRTAMSDLDVAVYGLPALTPPASLELQSEIMELTKSPRVDLVDLRVASPLLAYEVVSSGELLFTRDIDGQNRFEQKSFLHYFDTQHLRDIQNRYLREHLRMS